MDGLLLSGGIDSIAIAFWLRPTLAITIDYGQVSAEGEIRAAAHVAGIIGVQHEVICVDVRDLGAGDLAGRSQHSLAPESEWWPFRNQLLITLAAMRAVTVGVDRLMIGTVASDSFHADGSTPFIACIDSLCSLQEGGLRIAAPAIGMSSSDLVRASKVPREILAWAHSCHTSPVACGMCRGCNKHRTVMSELGYETY